MKTHTIALIGNQNSGKTTVFNALTGANQHIGNFPGITVDKKIGVYKKHIHIVDLPGIYSLTPYSNDEKVATQFLMEENPSLIINIVDATNLERNLYLTMQLLEWNIPIVIVLNMVDIVYKNGGQVDTAYIEKILGVPVIAISAQKQEGLQLLSQTIERQLQTPTCKIHTELLGEFEDSILQIERIIPYNRKLPTRYCAIKVLAGDTTITHRLQLTKMQKEAIKKIKANISISNIETAIIQKRYQCIEKIHKQAISSNKEDGLYTITSKIDALLMHKYLGIPIFLGIMFVIFYLTFHVIGAPLQQILEYCLASISDYSITMLSNYQVTPWLLSLLSDGVFNGIASVLSFLPIIMLLFFFLSLLEDSGYMARIAFIMDALLQKVGLSGKSFVPMLLGFGCSVPAIMATRTLPSERDRKLTILLIPFISCSAKLPIYGMIVNAFFPTKAAITMLLLYGIGIFVAIISALLLKVTIFKEEFSPFIMELPMYRLPTPKNLLLGVFEKAKDFIHKAFTIIFLASICIWFLQSFNLQLSYISNSEESILAQIGYTIAWLFKPLGFNDWQLATSLFTGIIAKESVVSTISVLLHANSETQLYTMLQGILSPASALSFLTFTVLYMPCIAAFATTKKELGSLKKALYTATFQTFIAYIVAFIVYTISILLS